MILAVVYLCFAVFLAVVTVVAASDGDSGTAFLFGLLATTMAICSVLFFVNKTYDDDVDAAKNQAKKNCYPLVVTNQAENDNHVLTFDCANDGKLRKVKIKAN